MSDRIAVPWGIVLLLAAPVAPAAPAEDALVRERLGPSWRLLEDPASGRPRRLAGGAIPWLDPLSRLLPPEEVEPALLEQARRFVQENADLLSLDPAMLRPAREHAVVAAGAVHVVHLDVTHQGVRVEGGRLSLAISHGNLVYVHVVGAEPFVADPRPGVAPHEAVEAALESARLPLTDVLPPEAELVFVRERGEVLLRYRVTLIERRAPRRLVVSVDARTGGVVAVADETVSACDPLPPSGPERRVLAGVRPERADDPEREELLPRAIVGAAAAGVDGFFAPPPAPYAATLDGVVRVDCVDCTSPVAPSAPASPSGDADFGAGGADAAGNGQATPADRAAYFHAEAAKRYASRWLSLPFVADPLVVHTNIPSACNAYWDGASLNFFRSSPRCSNTGEIRDVVQHEWGHGLDQNDGQPPASLSVDAATGEAAADLVAMLRSRDACIGESFFDDEANGPSRDCSGVRDLDERAVGHEHGNPATLSTSNVLLKCSPSAFYRGVLGGEGHCEGEIFGQAAWHLAQNLLTGRSYSDGSVVGPALAEEDAWQVLEQLFFVSRPLLACYAPSSLQSLGTSAHDAFLVADDTGDGLGNGTPHAAYLHEAFAHHGMAETPAPAPTSAACGALPDPAVVTSAPTDPGSGLPAVRLDWSDVGAVRYHVLRADDADDAYLPLAAPVPAGTTSFVDRGVLPARGYRYRVLAEDASGCISAGAVPVLGAAGPLLRIAAAVLDDSVGGNGDGLLAEGEEADVRLTLENAGSGAATNVSVTLSATDPRLAVTVPGPVAYGTLGPGASVPGPSAFHVRADPGVPRRVVLVASAETDQGCLRASWQVEIAVVDLVVAGQQLFDSVVGDGDGTWEPGETSELSVDLRDDGLLDAAPVDGTITLRAPVPGVTIVQGTAVWGAIASGARVTSAPPHFVLAADPALGPRTAVPLWLAVRVGGAPHRTYPLDVSVGGMPAGSRGWSAPGSSSPLPLVLQLTDDDGDAAITRCDVPDVVVARAGLSTIAAYSGADGSPLWEVPTSPCGSPGAFDSIAGGDVDGDGDNDVVWGDDDSWVCALDSDGSLLWQSAQQVHSHWSSGSQPQAWDLDADGAVEIVAGHTALRGADGSVLWDHVDYVIGRDLVGDLDLDGRLEVIHGSGAYRADGSTYELAPGGRFRDNLVPGALVNLDDDAYPEVVSLGAGGDYGTVWAIEHDGTPKWDRPDLPGDGALGPPCFGDFDRDGRAEIGAPTRTAFQVLDDDGATIWSQPTDDSSGASGCSVFDFDGDGPPEILYRDQVSLRVFDGRTGEVLWSTPVSSGTAYEFPYVADVDGDGLAEILVQGSIAGLSGQLHVFENAAWPSARGVWNLEDYQVENVEEDGSIVTSPFPRWLGENDFRGQESVCPCTGPEPAFTFLSDCDRTTCFTATVTGGRAPFVLTWDFGDGSPPVTGLTPCHPYAAPGDYGVRVAVEDDNGCVVDAGRVVRVREALAASIAADVQCAGSPTCLAGSASGGLGPMEGEWDFGDGSPRERGLSACHDFAPGSYTATFFVRDSQGCLAETTVALVVDDPAALPEVSGGASPTPLRVRRSGASDLAFDFEATGRDVGLYEGDVMALRSSGYTHEASFCRQVASSIVAPMPSTDRYFLVVAAGCVPRAEGPYGEDSLGRRRPSAADLLRLVCP